MFRILLIILSLVVPYSISPKGKTDEPTFNIQCKRESPKLRNRPSIECADRSRP